MKNFHIAFPEVFGRLSLKRMVFENPGETESLALAGLEAGKEKEMNPESGQKVLDKSFDDAKQEIDRKAAEYSAKYEGKEDADKAKAAIEASRKNAQIALEARYKLAGETIKKNADTAANEMATTLVEQRKKEAAKKIPDHALGFDDVEGKAGFIWSPSGKANEGEWNHLGSADFKVALVSMLRAVYVAEGPKAAEDLKAKMLKGPLGFDEMQMDKDYMFMYGQNHNPPLIQFNPDNDDDEVGNTRQLTGLIFGYNHAAESRLSSDEAKEAYRAYLAASGKKCGNAPRSMSQDDILTPDQWANLPENRDKYLSATVKLDEKKLDEDREAKIAGYFKKPYEVMQKDWDNITGQRERLYGLLMGRLKAEPDPKKWDGIIKSTFESIGLNGDTPNILDVTYGKEDEYEKAHPVNVGEFAKSRSDQAKGYITGLIATAEDNIKDPDLLAKYKEKINEITSSKAFGDTAVNGTTAREAAADSNRFGKEMDEKWTPEVGSRKGKADEALYQALRGALPTPAEFLKQNQEAEEKKAEESPREKYVDDLLADMPADKAQEKATLRGVLMAAIGPRKNADGKDKTTKEMDDLVAPIVKAMGYGADHKFEQTTMDDLKKITDGRSEFGEFGKKTNDVSKGYLSTLLYQAEQKYKDNPGLLEAYKKHLTDAVNGDSYKDKVQEKLDKIKRIQDNLNDPIYFAKLSEEDKRSYRDQLAQLNDDIFMETRKATEWPEDFAKEKAPELKAELMKGNKELFLDKYSDKVGNYTNAKKSLDAILASVPKEKVTDEYKKKMEEFQKALKDPDVKTQEARLGVLAQAMDYVAHFQDEKASETRFREAADRYTFTTKILQESATTARGQKYVTDMAKGLGYEVEKDKMDPQVSKALDKVKEAKEEDRAAVMAEQLGILFASAPTKSATSFTKEDFDDYSKYIGDRKAAEDAKKKSSSGGGVGGGSPSAMPGGSSSAPGSKAPEKKEEGGETPLEEKLHKALSAALAPLVRMTWAELQAQGVTTPEEVMKRVNAGIQGQGLDLKGASHTFRVGNLEISVNNGAIAVADKGYGNQFLNIKRHRAEEESAVASTPIEETPDPKATATATIDKAIIECVNSPNAKPGNIQGMIRGRLGAQPEGFFASAKGYRRDFEYDGKKYRVFIKPDGTPDVAKLA